MRTVVILQSHFDSKIADLNQMKDLLESGWMTTSGNAAAIREKIKNFGL